jgi:hypothetical protein
VQSFRISNMQTPLEDIIADEDLQFSIKQS